MGKGQERASCSFPTKTVPLLSGEKTKFLNCQDLTRRDMLTYMLRQKQLSETAVEKTQTLADDQEAK